MDKRIEELLPFYALDALTEEERVMVAAYLAAHPEAQAQISEMEEVVSALPYGAPPVTKALRSPPEAIQSNPG
jgi:anti-sigma factor RsiW